MSNDMEHRKGDLLEQTDLDIICHGVNCRGLMGAGIAKQISTRWPDLFAEYRELCGLQKDPATLLGDVSFYETRNFWIANLFTRVDPGADVRYEAVRQAVGSLFWKLGDPLTACGVLPRGRKNLGNVGFCQIGSGIGGLEWAAVKEIIIAANHGRRRLVEVENA